MREKRAFFVPSRGACGGGVSPQGLSIYMDILLSNYYNISKFGTILRGPPRVLNRGPNPGLGMNVDPLTWALGLKVGSY